MTLDPGSALAMLAAALSQLSALVDQLPPTLRQLVESVPAVDTPEGVALFGSGGMIGITTVLKLVARLRPISKPSVPSGTTAGGTVVTTARDGSPPGSGHVPVAFTLPSFVPLPKGIRRVSHYEIHAVELGLAVGALSVWLFRTDRRTVAAVTVLAFVAGVLVFDWYKSKGVETARMEPWYALLSAAVGGGVAYYVLLA